MRESCLWIYYYWNIAGSMANIAGTKDGKKTHNINQSV